MNLKTGFFYDIPGERKNKRTMRQSGNVPARFNVMQASNTTDS